MTTSSKTLLGGVLLAGSLVLAAAPGANAQLKEVRMMEAGGASGDSIEAGYLKPFTEKTGIKTNVVATSGGIGVPLVPPARHRSGAATTGATTPP